MYRYSFYLFYCPWTNNMFAGYNNSKMNSILLTGVSGGMGLATAKKLTSNGFRVFGLDIKEPKEKIDGLTLIKTDLTDIYSIKQAYALIHKETEELDAIISMAGIYELDSLLEMDEEKFLKIFNINVFAVYRLNKIFVPLLKDKGKVIIISSELAPLDPLPFTGVYAITKSTVDKYAYSLRMELQLINKQVVVIRPGAVDTSMIDVSTTKLDNFVNSTNLYKCNAKRFKEIVNKIESHKIPPEKIANLINKIINKKKPRYIYKINRNPLLILLGIMPKRFQNWVIKKTLEPK